MENLYTEKTIKQNVDRLNFLANNMDIVLNKIETLQSDFLKSLNEFGELSTYLESLEIPNDKL